jgi:hypothetical protein
MRPGMAGRFRASHAVLGRIECQHVGCSGAYMRSMLTSEMLLCFL